MASPAASTPISPMSRPVSQLASGVTINRPPASNSVVWVKRSFQERIVTSRDIITRPAGLDLADYSRQYGDGYELDSI